MATTEQAPDMGRRVLWGFLLTGLCLFLALSVFSYDWHDIGLLQTPPTTPFFSTTTTRLPNLTP